MPLEFMGRAPYAPSTAILAIVTQHRKTPIAKFDAVILDRQVGISESLIPRTLSSLQMLGFTDENNDATPAFTALARVPDGELKSALGNLITEAYAPVIQAIGGNLADATPEDVTSAFRSYNPLGQLERMVQLFTGLMGYVGLMPELVRRRGPAQSRPAGSGAQKGKATEKGDKTASKGDRKGEEKADTSGGSKPPADTFIEAPAYSRTIQLADNAGTILLTGSVNPFVLKGKTRDLVFGLIDLMDDYEVTVGDGGKSEGGEDA